MDGSHLSLVPPAKRDGVWDQSRLNGAQATLALSAMHVTRHSTMAAASGESWDRLMLEMALRDTRAALDEIEALFAAPTGPAVA